MRSQPSHREKWKGRVLKTTSLTHGTRLFLVHILSKHMKADGFVSHSRWKLANEAGISERQVTRYISNAVDTGWLAVLQPGYRSMTAEYKAQYPDPQSRTQDVPHFEPEKGDVNGPPLRVTNTSRIHAGKRDVLRPTTSSSTTRPCVEVLDRTHNPSRRPHLSSLRFGFGICYQSATARTHCRTRPKPVERHRTHGLDAAPVETLASGTGPATRFVCFETRPRRKAQR